MDKINILTPDLPESVRDATIITWHKKIGDFIKQGEILLEIETDKVVLEIPAIENGILSSIIEKEGSIVKSRQILGHLLLKIIDNISQVKEKKENNEEKRVEISFIENEENKQNLLSPSVRRLLKIHNIDAKDIIGSGTNGRIIQEDIDQYLIKNKKDIPISSVDYIQNEEEFNLEENFERRVPMTRLRKRIAERLLESKKNTAMLTTFNEVNMKVIINCRKKYEEIFKNQHNVRLGFMSFFVKAVLESLKKFPEVNACIEGDDIIYHNYFDISIAISTPRGLVTPVLKNVDSMSLDKIEKKIQELSIKGKDGTFTVQELTGGNFTISNGGIFGSMMSTPIINPPQSAILGMHTIKDRPMVLNGKIVILPMMYLALSYDHRLIDGKESVSFLNSIKEILEDPIRLLLNI